MKLLQGLYAITDTHMVDDHVLVSAVGDAIAGGARIIQYRNKTLSPADKLRQARLLKSLCAQHSIPLIVNDDIALAEAADADGVHLGKADGALEDAKLRLGKQSIIGISCYNERHRAEAAVAAGASYIAFGAFFPSSTKPNAPRASLDLLIWAKRELDVPTVAIGGVTPHNAAPLIDAGADMLAVIQGVFGKHDINAAAQSYADLFSSHSSGGVEAVGRENLHNSEDSK